MARYPLLRVILLLAVLSGCGSEDDGQLLSVCAPRAWLGAKVQLDGQVVAQLEEMKGSTGLIGAAFRKLYPDSPLHDVVAINLPLASWQLEAGQHQIVVEATGGASQSLHFRYPFTEGETQCIIFVYESEAVVGDACEVR